MLIINFKCGCGVYNYSWQDWISHFKYGSWRNGFKNLLKTRIEITVK